MNLPAFLAQDKYGYVHLAGHRVSLEDLVWFYNEGDTAEVLSCRFPTVPLALIHKVIAFYLENQPEADAYLSECQAESERQRAAAPRGPDIAELRRRLEARRNADRP